MVEEESIIDASIIDDEFDEPISIAVIGAGPIGLEAALYARFLGFDVTVYERGEIAANVLEWQHVQLFTPFKMNRSSLGIAAIQAQFKGSELPADEDQITGQTWRQRYLLPLANSDLLRGRIETNTKILKIGRGHQASTRKLNESYAAVKFRLLVQQNDKTTFRTADVVIDTTGTSVDSNWMGPGGIPAIGEIESLRLGCECDYRIWRGLPDVLGQDRSKFEGMNILVIGSGFSAATNVVAMSDLAQENPATRLTWITCNDANDYGPIKQIPGDPLEYRQQLTQQANLVATNSDQCHWLQGTTIFSVERKKAKWIVRVGRDSGLNRKENELEVDQVIANVGYHADFGLIDQLEVQQCPRSGGPLNWAISIAESTGDGLQHECKHPDAIKTSEPGFYILGSKTYGRDPRFFFSVGLQQIKAAFSLIGERENLDLYATTESKVSS